MVGVREDWMVRPQVHYSSLVGAGRYVWMGKMGKMGRMGRMECAGCTATLIFSGHGFFFSFQLLF